MDSDWTGGMEELGGVQQRKKNIISIFYMWENIFSIKRKLKERMLLLQGCSLTPPP